MSPMLLAVGPILGNGRVIGFTGKGKPTAWVSYRAEALSGLGLHPSAPIDVRDFTPMPAVAVLTGPNTVSAGEAVAIGFHGRPNTRSFGGTSAGATNSPGNYRLADGATLRFATYWDTDRTGRLYRGSIQPDVAVVPDWNDRPVRVATRWLRAQPSCR